MELNYIDLGSLLTASDGNIPVQDIWGLWSIPSLLLLLGPLWEIVHVRVLSIGQIELYHIIQEIQSIMAIEILSAGFCHLPYNDIVNCTHVKRPSPMLYAGYGWQEVVSNDQCWLWLAGGCLQCSMLAMAGRRWSLMINAGYGWQEVVSNALCWLWLAGGDL